MPLAFPSSGGYDDHSEYTTTPFSPSDIPIDPQLLGDPQPVRDGHSPSEEQPRTPTPPPFKMLHPYGDPFDPQFCEPPRQPTPPPPLPRPLKRKRKRAPQREEECSFCQGTDERNKKGEPEEMITCSNCGRSGHPTCLLIAKIIHNARSWPWKCIECKACEVCQKKGDDRRILFCDNCDRGWHMYCLQPPLYEEPVGTWVCPACPPPSPSASHLRGSPAMSSPARNDDSHGNIIRSSTSNHSKTKGKGKAVDYASDPVSENEVKIRNKNKDKDKRGKVPATLAPPTTLRRPRLRVTSPVPPALATPRMVVRLRLPAKAAPREEEPPNPFEEILEKPQADTSRTAILPEDKSRFEKSRSAAEEKLGAAMKLVAGTSVPTEHQLSSAQIPSNPSGHPVRPLRSLTSLPIPPVAVTPPPSPGASNSPAPGATPPLRIRLIRFGEFEINTWYDAPFPEEYASVPEGRLWMCEFCLKYMKSKFCVSRHRMKCKARHPPGDEIYRDGPVSIFEVDGRKNKIYCQNLCLLSKMFLDHKSLFYDVEPFLFYVMTEVDESGARFVGYFSKEKRSPKDFNVSCIMTLPVRQRKGWGNLLIDFSYLLSKKEGRVGSPERPLSALGALSYRNYWTLALMKYLQDALDGIRMEDISAKTAMKIEDIYATLREQDMVFVKETTPPVIRPAPGTSIKYKRTRTAGGVARRNLVRKGTSASTKEESDVPIVIPTNYEIKWDRAAVDKFMSDWEKKGYLRLKPERLKWSPYLLSRTKKTEVVVPNFAPSVSDGNTQHGLISRNGSLGTDGLASGEIGRHSLDRTVKIESDTVLTVGGSLVQNPNPDPSNAVVDSGQPSTSTPVMFGTPTISIASGTPSAVQILAVPSEIPFLGIHSPTNDALSTPPGRNSSRQSRDTSTPSGAASTSSRVVPTQPFSNGKESLPTSINALRTITESSPRQLRGRHKVEINRDSEATTTVRDLVDGEYEDTDISPRVATVPSRKTDSPRKRRRIETASESSDTEDFPQQTLNGLRQTQTPSMEPLVPRSPHRTSQRLNGNQKSAQSPSSPPPQLPSTPTFVSTPPRGKRGRFLKGKSTTKSHRKGMPDDENNDRETRLQLHSSELINANAFAVDGDTDDAEGEEDPDM